MDSIRKAPEMEDAKINVKLKISALWIAMLFVFAYGDIFGFQKPGVIEGIMEGKMWVFRISQVFLFLTSLYIVIPSIMVFLSLALKPRMNRSTNIAVAIFYIVTVLGSCIGETWAFYILGSIVETLLLGLIVWHAWNWPRAEGTPRRQRQS